VIEPPLHTVSEFADIESEQELGGAVLPLALNTKNTKQDRWIKKLVINPKFLKQLNCINE